MTQAAVTPLVDLDDLSITAGRCKSLACTLQLVMSGSGLPSSPEREGLCYDLAALIEELSGKVERLVGEL